MKTSLKKVFSVLCVGVAFAAAALDVGDSLMLWMVDTQDSVKDNGKMTTVGALKSRGLSDSSANDKNVNAARVRVFENGRAKENTWLNLYYQEGGEWKLGEGMYDLSFTEGQSYTEPDPGGTYVGPSWADFGQYADSRYSFAIELGFLNDDCEWFTMAYGEILDYDKLDKFHTIDSVGDPRYVAWTSTYTVPEPTSGLLFLMGSALLALKRRKCHRVNC